MMTANENERVLLVSGDSHAGPTLETLPPR